MDNHCTICGELTKRSTLCEKHYMRFYRRGTTDLKLDAWGIQWINLAAFSITDECILWPFHLASGYGRLKYKNRFYTAPRLTLIIATGFDPGKKLMACHGPCHERRCCNPAHLYWGDFVTNARDKHRDGTMPIGKSHPNYKDGKRCKRTAAVATGREFD
jgi:hypothetical protein